METKAANMTPVIPAAGEKAAKPGGKLVSLQILRGIAALLIVMGHATSISGSAAGVELFFIISGFIMMYITRDGLDRFLIKRVVRVVPMYWIATTAFVLLLSPPTFNVAYYLKSLFFLNKMPILNVGWTLNFEVKFYIIFWLSAKLSHKYRGFIAAGACLVWSIINFIFFRSSAGNVLMPLVFASGILAYYIYIRLRDIRFDRSCRLLFAALIVISALFLLFSGKIAAGLIWNADAGAWAITRPIAYGVPMFIAALSLLLALPDGSGRVVRALAHVGDISYSLYLWHIVVQELIVALFAKAGYVITTPSTVLFMLLTTAVSLIVAHFSYRFLEKPLAAFLRGKLLPDKKPSSP